MLVVSKASIVWHTALFSLRLERAQTNEHRYRGQSGRSTCAMANNNLSLFSVKAVLILDSTEGSRVFAKYYHQPSAEHQDGNARVEQSYVSTKSQRAFEKGLHEKTAKQTGDIILFDNRVVVYKHVIDVSIYVVGGLNENEVFLYNVVVALREALEILLKHSIDKRTIVENFDLVSLAVDEIVDDGIVLDTDPVIISSRVTRAPSHDTSGKIELNEQGLLNAYQIAKERLTERLKHGL